MFIFYLTAIESNNTGVDDFKEFEKLDPKIQRELIAWIDRNLSKQSFINYPFNSYSLKHLLPNGFYVNNGAFKGAMLKAGYDVLDKSRRNWNFNVYVKKERS